MPTQSLLYTFHLLMTMNTGSIDFCKFGSQQLHVHNGTFRQQFIKTFINLFSLLNVRDDVLNSVYYHVDEESQRAIDREVCNRYFMKITSYFKKAFWVLVEYYYCILISFIHQR